jgi:hypothetical protein
MKKAAVVAAVQWADGLVSESQNSVREGYIITYPDDWNRPEGARKEYLVLPEPSAMIQRMQLVAYGACMRLGCSGAAELVSACIVVERDKISTKAGLVKALRGILS